MTQPSSAPTRSTFSAAIQGRFEFREYRPPFLLRNGHAQTVLASSWLRRSAVRPDLEILADSRADILHCSEGVRLEVWRSLPKTVERRGRVICIHGWEGCFESNYMVAAASHLLQAGYEVLRLHLRDHGATHHLNRDVFHSCRISEVVDAVELLAGEAPELPPVVLGFRREGRIGHR